MDTCKTLSSYLPYPLAARLLRAPEQSLLNWSERIDAAVLFADMAGFSSLAEALGHVGPKGTEELTRLLNDLFTPLIETVHHWGGAVGKFAGDAMSVLFAGAGGDERALACALALQRQLPAFAQIETLAGPFCLRMRFGLAAGSVLCAVVGDERRAEFVYAGRPMDWASQAEQRAALNEVVLHSSMVERFPAGSVDLHHLEHGYARLIELAQEVVPAPRPPLPDTPDLGGAILEMLPFLHPLIYERLMAGQRAFVNEHRWITVLFVSFEGIDYDQAGAVDRLSRYVARARQVVADYDGFLCRVDMGDKGSRLLILFGAPVAHEDDAERALLCALSLQRMAAGMESMSGQRIGINSGRLFVGNVGSSQRQEYTVIGDAINLSARLMQAADPGQVLVGQSSYGPAMAGFVWQELPLLRVKGKELPVRVYGLIGRADRQSLAPRYALPMVGRQAELTRLEGLLRQVEGTGQGQVIGITAEAGLGKSRLAAEVIGRALDTGFQGFAGSGVSHGTTTPYLAWRSLLRGLLGLGEGLPHGEQVEAAGRHLAAVHPDMPLRLPLLGDALGLDIPDNDFTASFDANLHRESLFALVVDLIRAEAAQGPLLLVLEDAHWLDDLSRELARYVARQIVDLPVFFLTVYRPPEVAGYQPLWSTPLEHLSEIRLGPFSTEESAELIRLKLAGRDLPSSLVEKVEQRAQGNPFFVDEFVNLLLEQEVDLDDAEALAAVRVPDSLQTLIVSRLDRLGETEKMTVRVASVIGRLFRARWLLAIYPEAIRERLLPHDLDRLSAANLILLEKPEPELEYLFKHAITQEVVYGTLSFSNRRMLHERVADYIEQAYVEDLGAWYGILAYHCRQAERPEKELPHVHRAAERAARQYAIQQAADFCSRAIDLIQEHSLGTLEVEFDLRMGRYNHLATLGKKDRLERDVTALMVLAKGLDPARQVQAWIMLGSYHHGFTRCDEAISSFDTAMALARLHGDHLGMLTAMGRLGGVDFFLGDYEQGKARLRQVMAEAGKAGWRQESHACGMLGWIAYDEGDYGQAERYWLRGLALSQEHGYKPGEATSLNELGALYETLCYVDRALEHVERGLALAVQIGDRGGERSILGTLGETWMRAGQYERAIDSFLRSIDMADRVGELFGQAYIRSRLAKAVLEGPGDLAWADRLIRRALEIGRPGLGPETSAWLLNVQGQVLRQQGESEGAQSAWEEAAGIRREIQQVDWLLLTLAYLGELHLEQGALEEARALAEEMLALLFPEEGAERESVAAGLACCRILRAAGEEERARELLVYAYELLQRQAGRIESEEYRRSFLEQIPLHRETVAAYLFKK